MAARLVRRCAVALLAVVVLSVVRPPASALACTASLPIALETVVTDETPDAIVIGRLVQKEPAPNDDKRGRWQFRYTVRVERVVRGEGIGPTHRFRAYEYGGCLGSFRPNVGARLFLVVYEPLIHDGKNLGQRTEHWTIGPGDRVTNPRNEQGGLGDEVWYEPNPRTLSELVAFFGLPDTSTAPAADGRFMILTGLALLAVGWRLRKRAHPY